MLTIIIKLLFTIQIQNIYGFEFNGGFKYLTKEIASYLRVGDDARYETRWLQQKLDHFDSNKKRTWRMRYFAKTDFWKSGGPIYLFLGGEGEASPNFLNTGIMYELAKETNGAMYASEHRYYGKSMPVQGTSVENFKYLSVYQALEDNAHLLRIIKLNPIFYKSKIIVIGGSYAGNLAAWMRLLYPELVYAAIASSAPVLAKKDFYEYLETVNEVYGKYGTDDCLNEINQRFIQYETMFETADGIEKLKEEENICNDVDMSIPENKQLFFLDKASKFMSNTQYGTITVIKDHCAKLNENPKELNIYGPSFYRDTARCYNYDFNYMINQTYKNQMTAYACWLYQTCTTFGYFQSTSSRKQPFTNNVPVEFYVKMCTSTFGSKFNDNFIEDGIELVNKMFGGLRPNVTKVVFVNGDMDPWSKLSVLKNISSETPAIFIPRSSHCRDLFSNREGDHEELKEARKNIKDLIKNWIGAEE